MVLSAVLASGVLAVGPASAQVLEPEPAGDSSTAAAPDTQPGGKKWQIQVIPIPEPPKQIHGASEPTSLDKIVIETGSGAWYGLADCAAGLCAELLTEVHAPETLPAGALPGSHVAHGQHRIAQAWLAEPAQRFAGSTLGGEVAGSLAVEDMAARSYRLDLNLAEAFEDRRVRIADLGADGTETMLVIKSSETRGAALAAIELTGEGLLEVVAETEPAGMPRGWVNPVGTGDFTGGGEQDIALVRSPDDGGKLQILRYANRAFQTRFTVRNVSNHVPGSDIVDMAAIADFDGDGSSDIAIPSGDRRRIRVLSFRQGQLAEPADIDLPSQVVTEIAGVAAGPGKRPYLLMGLADGELVLLH